MKIKLFIACLFIALTTVHAQKKIIIGGGTVNTQGGGGSSNYVTLSTRGIISDAIIDTGYASFGTDQTVAIQNILNTASKQNPLTVYWDVKISTTGLQIKSYTTIITLPGCGAILRDSSGMFLLRNYNWTAHSNARLDSFITIIGGIWNANAWRSGIARQLGAPVGPLQPPVLSVVSFMGVKELIVKNSYLLNAYGWAVMLFNIENMIFDNLTIDQGATPKYGQDGITSTGGMKNITIINSKIRCGDDRITFCPNSTIYNEINGDVSNIRIDNIQFLGHGKGFTFYVAGGNEVRDIFISNIYGTSESYWFGLFNSLPYPWVTGNKIMKNIHVENVSVEVTNYIGYGETNFSPMVIYCSVEDMYLKNIRRDFFSSGAATMRIFREAGAPPVNIQNLWIDGLNTYNLDPGNYPNHIEIAANASVGNLYLTNSNLDFGSVPIDRSLLINYGTITNLFMSNITVNRQRSVVKNSGTISNILANGIIHTNIYSTDAAIQNTGTITKATFVNCIVNQLTSGTIGTKDSSAILHL